MPEADNQPNQSESRPGDASRAEPVQLEELELSDAAAEYVRQLQAERDEAFEGRLRALADFRNYQRRAMESEQRAYASGTVRAVRAIMPLLDQFDHALAQNPEQLTVDKMIQAVRMMNDEFHKALQSLGVERIEPAPGDPFDPHRHEAMMRQNAPDVAPNSVVSTMQTGYALGDLVLRPARVIVSVGAEDEE